MKGDRDQGRTMCLDMMKDGLHPDVERNYMTDLYIPMNALSSSSSNDFGLDRHIGHHFEVAFSFYGGRNVMRLLGDAQNLFQVGGQKR
jgi:hypothetical protein